MLAIGFLLPVTLLFVIVFWYCHTRLHLGFSAKLKIWQASACKMEPRSGIIFCKNIYVAAAPIYVAAAPIYVAAAPIYVAAAPIYVAAAHDHIDYWFWEWGDCQNL